MGNRIKGVKYRGNKILEESVAGFKLEIWAGANGQNGNNGLIEEIVTYLK